MERGAVRLTIVGVCFRRPSPRIYRWEGEEDSQGAPQVGGNLLGGLGHFAPPLPYPSEEGRKGEAESLPFLLSSPFPSS
mgnify:CR=1 FL=1